MGTMNWYESYDPKIDGNGRTPRADEDPAANIPTDCDVSSDTSALLLASCEVHALLYGEGGVSYWDAVGVNYSADALITRVRSMPTREHMCNL